jgi:hypothetical protein
MDRKQKEREYFAHHAETFKKLKLASPSFTLKMAFYEKGRFGRNIQLYESELKKGEDLYMEFIDVIRDDAGAEKDYSPMLEDRPLFKFKANPFYAEEYELRERPGYSVYIISSSELIMIQPDGSEISYSLYEKRKEEAKKAQDGLPKLQKSLAPFPDFEEEFPKKETTLDLAGSDFDIDKVVAESTTTTLANISLKDFAAIMLVTPVSDKTWLNDLIRKSKSEI